MHLCKGIDGLTFVILALAVAQQAQAQMPALPPGPPGRTNIPARSEEEEIDRRREPLPDTGFTATFSYSRSTQYDKVYEIRPVGDPEPSLVSEDYLRLVLRNDQLGDDMKLTAAMAYPVMALKWYDMVMPKHYPDATSPAPTEAFTRRTLTSDDGTRVTLDQDSLAFPYVRVTVTGADGKTEEFSINRQVVDDLLHDTHFTDTDRVFAFRSHPYRLPDQARYDFKRLSAAQLYELAAQGETIQKQDMIRMRNIFEAQIRAQAAASARTNQVADVRQEYMDKIKKQWAPKAPSAMGPVAMTSPTPPPAMPLERRASSRTRELMPHAAAPAAPASRSNAVSILTVVLIGLVAAGIAFYLGRRSR